MFGGFKKLWNSLSTKLNKNEEKKNVSTKTETNDKPHPTSEQKQKKGLFRFWKNMFSKSKKNKEQKGIRAPSETDEKLAPSPQEKLHKTYMDLLYRKGKAESALEHETEAIKHVTTEKQEEELEGAIKHHQEQVNNYTAVIKENRKEHDKYAHKATQHDVKPAQTPKKIDKENKRRSYR